MTFQPYRDTVAIYGHPDAVAGVAFHREPGAVTWVEAQHQRRVEIAGIVVDEPGVLVVLDDQGRTVLFLPMSLAEWNGRTRHQAINQAEARRLDMVIDGMSREW